MRIFISADMEGTAGCAHWDETEHSGAGYAYIQKQMTAEVAAACRGAMAGGASEIFVKDAHGSSRNIFPDALPESARILRGWANDPYIMMAGLTKDYDGVIFTGYHSAAGTNDNPLSHTLNTGNNFIKINGEYAGELMLNSLTAAYTGVPILCVTGDAGLCEWMHGKNPHTLTVPVSEGIGNGSISIHPRLAEMRIKETAQVAMALDFAQCMFPMPEHFDVEVSYKKHFSAKNASWYPGATLLDAHRVSFAADDYMDVLKFIYFCV